MELLLNKLMVWYIRDRERKKKEKAEIVLQSFVSFLMFLYNR